VHQSGVMAGAEGIEQLGTPPGHGPDVHLPGALPGEHVIERPSRDEGEDEGEVAASDGDLLDRQQVGMREPTQGVGDPLELVDPPAGCGHGVG
jgi:hypothetical protein